jgi:Flp pilus assembly protein TadD
LSGDFYLSEAKLVYAKAIELGMKDLPPYLGLANIAIFAHDVPEAEKWLAQATRIDPDHQKVLLAEGTLALEKGDLENARKFLGALEREGRKVRLALRRARRHLSPSRSLAEAVDAYRAALRLRRTNVEIRRKLGIALAKTGRKWQAEQKFREVLSQSADDADAWRELQKLGKRY